MSYLDQETVDRDLNILRDAVHHFAQKRGDAFEDKTLQEARGRVFRALGAIHGDIHLERHAPFFLEAGARFRRCRMAVTEILFLLRPLHDDDRIAVLENVVSWFGYELRKKVAR